MCHREASQQLSSIPQIDAKYGYDSQPTNYVMPGENLVSMPVHGHVTPQVSLGDMGYQVQDSEVSINEFIMTQAHSDSSQIIREEVDKIHDGNLSPLADQSVTSTNPRSKGPQTIMNGLLNLKVRMSQNFYGISPFPGDRAGLSLNMENHEPNHWSYFRNLAQDDFVRKDVSLMDHDHLGFSSPLTNIEEYKKSPLKGDESAQVGENLQVPEYEFEDRKLDIRNTGVPLVDHSRGDFGISTLQTAFTAMISVSITSSVLISIYSGELNENMVNVLFSYVAWTRQNKSLARVDTMKDKVTGLGQIRWTLGDWVGRKRRKGKKQQREKEKGNGEIKIGWGLRVVKDKKEYLGYWWCEGKSSMDGLGAVEWQQ
ncbi:hypothetical protein V6N11_013880 [Hibiscus sabdariffa]|uniref:Uncharacterized protein n=1 Tax=Hibiscus sabdariffa TaxID=183260 RepID=A0ABR2NJV0_9ROSI